MRKVNNADISGLNDFFDKAQANMKRSAGPPSHDILDAIVADREAIAIVKWRQLSEQKEISEDHP